MQRTMSKDSETSPTSQNEIKVTVKENEKSHLRLVGKYNPLLDTWATSDGTEQKAVSELTYDSCLEKLYTCIKLITQALVFLLTLAAGVSSRGLTFFMVSQLSSQAVSVCSPDANLASNTPLEKVSSHIGKVTVFDSFKGGLALVHLLCFCCPRGSPLLEEFEFLSIAERWHRVLSGSLP